MKKSMNKHIVKYKYRLETNRKIYAKSFAFKQTKFK